MKKYHIGMMIGHSSYVPHAELLIKSIRKNGGIYRECPIFVMTPKHAKVAWYFEEASQLEYVVPEELRKLPFADKMLAAADFEKNIDASYIWMDVDSIVLHEPKEWALYNKGEIGVKAVDQRNIGCSFEEIITPFWKEIYEYFGVSTDVFPLFSTVGQEKIKPYFNAGMIVIKEHKNLFTCVSNGLKDLLKNPIILEKLQTDFSHRIFFHQAVLSIAILAKYSEKDIYIMNDWVNYPLHFRSQYPRCIDFEELETIRYDTYFENHEAPIELTSLIEHNESLLKIRWYYE